MNRLSVVGMLFGLLACGDDASSSSDAASSGTGSSSSGGSDCTTSIHEDAMFVCPPECSTTVRFGDTTFCTESCSEPGAMCPVGTQCFKEPIGPSSTCLPPCESGACPEKMTCANGGDRCLPG